jgi:hypothetical protein
VLDAAGARNSVAPDQKLARSEKDDAIALANRVLDERPSADPDDDLAMLARQFLRALERTALYDELLYEVGRKHPGETRHETARRYIREREQRPSDNTGSLLRTAVVADARLATPESLRRGADVLASLKEPPTRGAGVIVCKRGGMEKK